MPAALADTAALICAIICAATELVEPVHFGAGKPSSLAASAKPYWVGTKKLFVVTWLTNQNCHDGVFGKATDGTARPCFAAAVRTARCQQGRSGGSRADQPGARQQLAAARAVPHVKCLNCLVDLRVDFSHRGPPASSSRRKLPHWRCVAGWRERRAASPVLNAGQQARHRQPETSHGRHHSQPASAPLRPASCRVPLPSGSGRAWRPDVIAPCCLQRRRQAGADCLSSADLS